MLYEVNHAVNCKLLTGRQDYICWCVCSYFEMNVVAQIKHILYTFFTLLPTLMYNGPAQLIPVTANGHISWTWSCGRGAFTSWNLCLFAICHVEHIWRTFLMTCQAHKIRKLLQSCVSTMQTPRRCNLMWLFMINNWMKWWDPSRSIGCFLNINKCVDCYCPQSQMIVSCKTGLKCAMGEVVAEGVSFNMANQQCLNFNNLVIPNSC